MTIVKPPTHLILVNDQGDEEEEEEKEEQPVMTILTVSPCHIMWILIIIFLLIVWEGFASSGCDPPTEQFNLPRRPTLLALVLLVSSGRATFRVQVVMTL